MAPAAAALSKKGWAALISHLESRGYDTGFGRHLYHDVAMNGLGDLKAEGIVVMQLGGTPSARVFSNSDVMNLKHLPRRFTRVRSGNEQSSLAQKIILLGR
jgi:hypothetical protein